MITLLQLFSKHAPNRLFISVLLGVLSGVAYTLTFPVLMKALDPLPNGLVVANEETFQVYGIYVANSKFAALFFGLCSFIILTRTVSQVLLAKISTDVASKLRRDLYERISNSSISSLEQRSTGELIQSMNTDVQSMVQGAEVIPDLLIQLSTLLGILFFLYYLNADIFVLTLMTIFFGAVTYQLPIAIGMKYFRRSRDHLDLLQEGFKGLVDGAKELKLNRSKKEQFMEKNLLLHELHIVRNEKKGITIVSVARSYGDLICFFSMGAVAFIFVNYHAISILELMGVIMVLLYITGPVAFIMSALPELLRSNISIQKVKNLYEKLLPESACLELTDVAEWKSIVYKSVCYQHMNTEELCKAPFNIGPVNMTIKRGEITFIVGGNGSGKSTLAKVATLHYPTLSGQISFDEEVVTSVNMNSYRQQIACVYSDYYLFKSLHNELSNDREVIAQVEYYLNALELKGKVDFHDGNFSTLKLSDGQRKRLALLVSFIDDKLVYVFDEWAADQDPYFKEVFYYEILPNLKAQGKAIIVISHDDRYFDVADQILMMEEGTFKENINPTV